MRKSLFLLGVVGVLLLVGATAALATEPQPAQAGRQLTLAHGLLGLAMALAVAFGAIGTAIAQARIGAAAAGAIAERPEISGTMLIFLVLPETLIIFGFLVAFLIWLRI